MILFIAPNPHKAKNREGFLQRVAAIDALFQGHELVYSEDLKADGELAQAIIDAELIYVHSIYNSNKILLAYEMFADKIITDLHGVVPEEEAYADNMEMHHVMDKTESEVFGSGKYFVAVTEAMVGHFKKKYPRNKAQWIVLPIHGDAESESSGKKEFTNVVYAGGAQPWQNAGLMVETINKSPKKYNFTILTHDKEGFAGLETEAVKRTVIKGVSSNQVAEYYGCAAFGFILRKDTLVNTVACPTKLVEYLCFGVLPIVLSERIGDFKALGYKYLTVDQFLEGEFTDKDVAKWIDANYKVYRKFVKLADKGKEQLIGTAGQIAKSANGGGQQKHSVAEIEQSFTVQRLTDKLIKAEYQIEVYKTKISEYAEAADYYRKKAEAEEKALRAHLQSKVHKFERAYGRVVNRSRKK